MIETKVLATWQKSDANLEQMQQRASMPEIARYEFLSGKDDYQLLFLERRFSDSHFLVLASLFSF
jgi:hypothetical protein